MKRLAENLIKIKSSIFTPDIIIGLRSDIWSYKTNGVLPKRKRFTNFLSFLVPFDFQTSKRGINKQNNKIK